MKKILITGSTSYIGNSFVRWLEENHEKDFAVDTLSLRDDIWKEKVFSNYDVIIHVAGIAHIKETKKNANLYYKINRDLAFEVAQKAKFEGVRQFIFISSMSVYGIEEGIIGKKTLTKPTTHYGKSKLQAEELISSLEIESFKVVILRPPMIYGRGCKGNYKKLAKLSVSVPVFPDINNVRSMIYIDNLSKYLKYIIENNKRGILFPQNKEYVTSSVMVKKIAEVRGNSIHLTKLFNPLLKIMKKNKKINKLFGSLVYEKEISKCEDLDFINFEDSIKLTEG